METQQSFEVLRPGYPLLRVSPWMLTYRRAFIVGSQVILIWLTYYGSFLLRFDFRLDQSTLAMVRGTIPAVVAIKLAVFYFFGLLCGWWRYVGVDDLWDITRAAALSEAFIYLAIAWILRTPGFPRSIYAIDFLLTILFVGGARFAVRIYTESARVYGAQKQMLIAGAGCAGAEIARELKRNSELEYKPIGFVDDDRTKIGMKIHGLKVLGSIEALPNLIEQNKVDCVLVAIPSARGATVERIVRKCYECKVEFKMLQGIGTRINGHAAREMRDLRVEDLLGREPVRLDLESIRQKLQGKVVLITGAGGSIGSELCRQVARFEPKALVMYERSENDLFKISTELSGSLPHLPHYAVVGDILDVAQLRETFAFYRPDSVFHAAAYKHVPMMETNCFQAVTNNIFGTYNVSLVARQFQVRDFVLISSDKAVNPSNIMGVTKRICELIVLSLQEADTRFVAVRFGNVLDSNGSVLPLFKRQLAGGGPLLVTHPDMKRYFMTIPEAVQLVLQASSMGRGGEIFVLKMGNPIRILDLAKNVIRLSGYEPGREIKIVYTGLRPGEKLCEELLFEREGMNATAHEKVSVIDGARVDFVSVRNWLDDLSRIVESKNVNTLVAKLAEIVPEYCPSKEMLSLCEIDRHDLAGRYRKASARFVAVAEREAA